MTLTEFENMRIKGVGDEEQPVYVFDTDEIFEYRYWEDMRRNCELICALASDYKTSTYLISKYAQAEVFIWGLIDERLCVVIETENDR